jgi:hypothetical protein
LIYTRNQGGVLSAHTTACAAGAGQLAILQWARTEGLEWHNALICGSAAESGDMNTLLYAMEQGGELNEHTMSCAAQAGKLHICQYLHTQQCPWDSDAAGNAAFYGHADVLGWLLQHGCPVNTGAEEGLLFLAACGGHIQVLQLLLDGSLLTTPAQFTDMLGAAAMYSHVAAAQWLRQHGAEWPDVLCDDYHDPWPDAAVAWARSEGCTSPTCFAEGSAY